jgi:hypothetical protein
VLELLSLEELSLELLDVLKLTVELEELKLLEELGGKGGELILLNDESLLSLEVLKFTVLEELSLEELD